MSGFLAGKTALITGSTRRGIGAATALQLGIEGANVVLNYGTGGKDAAAHDRAESLRQKIESLGAHADVFQADVRSEDEVKRMFDRAAQRFGGIDILVNNAGGAWIEQDFAAIETPHWEQAIRPEIDGTFLCIRAALPHMRQRRWGRIINVCLDDDTLRRLINAQYGHELDQYPYDFAIAKFAKREITRLIAPAEFKHGITVNNILPGIIEDMDLDEALHKIGGAATSSVYFDPVDVARAVLFLCHDNARGITQSDIRLPGNIYQRL